MVNTDTVVMHYDSFSRHNRLDIGIRLGSEPAAIGLDTHKHLGLMLFTSKPRFARLDRFDRPEADTQ